MSDMFIDSLRKIAREQPQQTPENVDPDDLAWAKTFYEENKPRFEIAQRTRQRELKVACCFSYTRELCLSFAEGFDTYQYRLVGKLRALEILLKQEEFRTKIIARPVKREGELMIGEVHFGTLEQVPASDHPRILELLIAPNLSELREEATYDQITLFAHW